MNMYMFTCRFLSCTTVILYLHSYVIVGQIYNFDSWRNRYENLVLISKNKIRSCKTFPVVIKI